MIDVVHRHEDWVHHAKSFARGDYPFLIATGPRGMSKSHTLKSLLPEDAVFVKGNCTPIMLFKGIYPIRKKGFIVIDDAEQNFMGKSNTLGLNLLKALCDTTPVRSVSYESTSLVKEDFPTSFETSAKIAIITNQSLVGNSHLDALEDRGIVVRLAFDSTEVHKYVGTFWHEMATGTYAFDQEVYEYIEDHLSLISKPSLRLYMNAAMLKRSGGDRWKQSIFQSVGMSQSHQVAKRLLEDSSYSLQEDRVKAFMTMTGQSRNQFFIIKKEIDALSQGVTIQETRSAKRNAQAERSENRHFTLKIRGGEEEFIDAG